MLALFILTVILIFLYEGVPLWKKRLWPELGTLGALTGVAAYLYIARVLGMTTPVDWLEMLLSPLGKIIFK